MINVFLIMALLIAVMGFSNTMALSVFERTREIGLLRAVGMGKRQIRAAILLEGSHRGCLRRGHRCRDRGWWRGRSRPCPSPATSSPPWLCRRATVVVYLVVSAVAGLLAALAPARRANRIDLLEAISYH